MHFYLKLTSISFRGVSRIFFIRSDFIFYGFMLWQQYSHRGLIAEIFLPPLKKILLLGHNRQEGEGAACLIITKEILVLASGSIDLNKSFFFYQGQKHTISNFIRGILRGGGHTPIMPNGWTRFCFFN